MTTDCQRRFPTTAGEINKVVENGSWINKNSVGGSPELQTQLLFNLAMPTSVLNRATRISPPAPIVIEKLVPHGERQRNDDSYSSSLQFSALSEDRLEAAVRLVKRDLRRKRWESVNNPSHKTKDRSPSLDKNNTRDHQTGSSTKEKQQTGSPTRSSTQMLVYTPQKHSGPAGTDQRQSPPTREPGRRAGSSEPQLSREIIKLQKELATYVQRIEQLVNKGQVVETVEPEEKRRIEIRQQEQAARSARIIYVLQQQIKEIQQDLDKLRSQTVKPTKKNRAVDRLAAAHRGAVRAIQAFVNLLSDPAECRVPAQCKELGQLIRQLSLCSAKVEVGQGSAVPETTLDILQKLETLDLALSKQESYWERELHKQSISPIREGSTRARGHSMFLPRVPHAPRARTAKAASAPKKSSAPKKPFTGRRGTGQPRRQLLDQQRSEILKAGIQNLMQLRELNEAANAGRSEMEVHKPATGAVCTDKSKPGLPLRDAGFQQPTVSSRLRESHLPQKEASVPWMPTSPHSPVKQRALSSRPEPRCLFSPGKSPSESADVQPKGRSQGKNTSAESTRPTQNEALRTQVGSATQWDEYTEHSRAGLQPLFDSVQQVGEDQEKRGSSCIRQLSEQMADENAASSDILTETLLENTTWAEQAIENEHKLLQEPLLENMLQRMEQIEKDEEEVRRRFAMISYSDPLLWETAHRKRDSCRPTSPQPIRLTKAAQRPRTTGDVVLQRPVEMGVVSENDVLNEDLPAPPPEYLSARRVQKKGGVHLSVPSSIQENILRYRENHDSYLRLVSHEAVGSFNPWVIAEGLAEELLMEALADVAAEFQDVCEEYGEAIFTSEFLQPIQSPSSML